MLGDINPAVDRMGYEVGAAVLLLREEEGADADGEADADAGGGSGGGGGGGGGVGGGDGTAARLEQLCVQPGGAEERARRAAMVLARAEAEARARQLTRLAAAGAGLGSEEAGWLRDAGFSLEEGAGGEERPSWCKLLN